LNQDEGVIAMDVVTMIETRLIPPHWHGLAISAALLAGAVVAAFVLHAALFWGMRRLSKKSNTLVRSILDHCSAPLRLAFPVFSVDLVLPFLRLGPALFEALEHVLTLAEMAAVIWTLWRLALVLSDALIAHYELQERDNFKARRIVTQIHVFRRVLLVIIVVLALGITLMSFHWGRELGGSILASAGIAGIAVGLAARPTIENLVAGVQLAITQPIRIEDVVIVEGQWGWIEEITTTYVVVRIWNLQRLVLPLTYFIQHPFQNWTRSSANLMGTVYVYADYTIPVPAVREALGRMVKEMPLWDGKVCVLQVTNATEHTVEMRALVSAENSSKLWDLRCAVREKLIEFVQKNYPQCLPKARAELVGPGAHLLMESAPNDDTGGQ
jgi:small-conductance mechanosensitive channel